MWNVSCKQEQLKQELAALLKQLSSQKKQFEEEAKEREHMQEEHDKELRHLKRDIKHKQVLPWHKVWRTCNLRCQHVFGSFHNTGVHVW